MRITPNDFKVVTWNIDREIFSGKPTNIPVIPDFGAGSITPKEEITTHLIIIGIQWHYELLYKEKSILNIWHMIPIGHQ